jgi:hypothetical protein
MILAWNICAEGTLVEPAVVTTLDPGVRVGVTSGAAALAGNVADVDATGRGDAFRDVNVLGGED